MVYKSSLKNWKLLSFGEHQELVKQRLMLMSSMKSYMTSGRVFQKLAHLVVMERSKGWLKNGRLCSNTLSTKSQANIFPVKQTSE